LGIDKNVDLGDPVNNFHNHDKEDDCGGDMGKHSGVKMSPERVSKGKKWGLGSPPAKLIMPGTPQYFWRAFKGDNPLAREMSER
jgi:hypothetical protein